MTLIRFSLRFRVQISLRIRLFNAVNIEFGYKPLQIFSPREVTTYGQEED